MRRKRAWSEDGEPPAPDAPPPMSRAEAARIKIKLQRTLKRLTNLDAWALPPSTVDEHVRRQKLRSRIAEIQQELEMAAQRTPRKGKKSADERASEAVSRRTPADVLSENGRSVPVERPRPRMETLENAIAVNRDGQPIVKAPDTVDPITGLTLQQMLFVEELIFTPEDAASAAARAGYSVKTSAAIAARLLEEEHVLKRLHQRRLELIRTRGMTAERLATELEKIAMCNLLDVLTEDPQVPGRYFLKPGSELTMEQRAGIASITEMKDGRISVKMVNKIDAINALARILGHDRPGTGRPGSGEAPPIEEPRGGGRSTEVKVNINFVTPPGQPPPVTEIEVEDGR